MSEQVLKTSQGDIWPGVSQVEGKLGRGPRVGGGYWKCLCSPRREGRVRLEGAGMHSNVGFVAGRKAGRTTGGEQVILRGLAGSLWLWLGRGRGHRAGAGCCRSSSLRAAWHTGVMGAAGSCDWTAILPKGRATGFPMGPFRLRERREQCMSHSGLPLLPEDLRSWAGGAHEVCSFPAQGSLGTVTESP